MNPTFRLCLRAVLAGVSFGTGWVAWAQEPPGRKPVPVLGASREQVEFEEKAVQRSGERTIRATETEGNRWQKELAKAFPDQINSTISEDVFDKWFDVISGDGKNWRRDTCPNKQFQDFFDRIVARLELGPVPSLQRDEYLRYARRNFLPREGEAPRPEDKFQDADRAFRVLDRDNSGTLERNEWTDRIRTTARTTDEDKDHRVDLQEYRAYFLLRVEEFVVNASKPPNQHPKSTLTKIPAGLPNWFTNYDTDQDGQIGLYEWRAAGKNVEDFAVMDLNGDGYLLPDEYQRYARQLEQERLVQQSEKAASASASRTRPEESASDRKKNAMPQEKEKDKVAGVLPTWFLDLDRDSDGQVGLYEWRAGGYFLVDFQELDLNGDGFILPEEYFKYRKLVEAEQATKPRDQQVIADPKNSNEKPRR